MSILTKDQVDEIERNTNFHECPDWIYRFANSVAEAALKSAHPHCDRCSNEVKS